MQTQNILAIAGSLVLSFGMIAAAKTAKVKVALSDADREKRWHGGTFARSQGREASA